MKLRTHHACLLLTSALLSATASAQWSSNPAVNSPIANFTGDQAVPKIAASGDGSTWMSWFDQRGGTYAVYAQRLDPQGVETFAHGGILVSGNPQSSSLQDWDMISDGAGGCVIAFTDTRNGSDLDVYAYRLDVAGNQLWGANGVTLSADADSEANPSLCRTTDGYFVCAWSHLPSPGPGHIRMQKIDGAGVLQYPANGLSITGAGTERPSFAQVVASDSGSYIVSYTREFSATSPNRHLRTQKFDGAGVAQWNSGNPVVVYDGNSLPIAYQHQLRSDGAGGAYYAWHRTITAYECYCQRVNSSGSEVFAHNGVLLCTDSTIELDPSLSVDPATGDATIFFDKRNAGQSMWSLSVQRISPAGTLLYPSTAIDLIPLDSVQKSIIKSVPFAGGAVCFCFRASGPVTSELIGFRVDAAGNSVWGAAPVVACTVVSGKQRVALATDSSNVVRMVWTDNRDDVSPTFQGYDTYAQDVGADGSLGVQSTAFTALCNGDGTDTPCPCTNPGLAGRGCDNTFATGGAALASSGVASVATPTLVLNSTFAVPFGPGLYYEGSATANPIAPFGVQFGNGLRCAGGATNRLEIQFANGVGAATTTVDLQAFGAAVASTTYYYQLWYRDTGNVGTCTPGAGFNFSGAISLTWTL